MGTECDDFCSFFERIMVCTAYRTIISKTIELTEFAIMFTAMFTSSWILIGIYVFIM